MEYTRKTLPQLFWPVFVEYLLLMLVGVADTVMLSFVGDKAVSGGGAFTSRKWEKKSLITKAETA